MEITEKSLPDFKTLLDEVSQNECETINDNKSLKDSKNDYLYAAEEIDPEKNVPCDLQSDSQNESVDLNKKGTYIEVSNEISYEETALEDVKEKTQLESSSSKKILDTEVNSDILYEESAFENVKEKVHLEFSGNLKKVTDEKDIHSTHNEHTILDHSSSDEEILQTRFPIQGEIDCNDSKDSSSFASTSDKESTRENESEIKKRPIIIQAEAYNEKKIVDSKNVDSDSEINKLTEKNEDQEAITDIANSLSVEADISNIETESSYVQNSIENKTSNSNFDKTKDGNETSPQPMKIEKNETFNQNFQEINDIPTDTIINDFLNGSFDISMFKPEKHSTMIEDDKTVREQKQIRKNENLSRCKEKKNRSNIDENMNKKKIHGFLNFNSEAKHKKLKNDSNSFTDSIHDSMIHLKRKISEKQTNSKRIRNITGKNKDEVTNITSKILNDYTPKPKIRSGNKYSNGNNQHTTVKSQSKYNDKDVKNLNNFDKKQESMKKNKTKNHKNEVKFKNFFYETTPLKKTRNLRSSSLAASKKIKEIEKLENVDSSEEILLSSDDLCSDPSINEMENNFKDLKPSAKYEAESKLKEDAFNNDFINTVSLDSLNKERKLESNKITRNKKAHKRKFEDIIDACHLIEECQLNMDNIASQENYISNSIQPDFTVEENEDLWENHNKNLKKTISRRRNKNTKRKGKKLFECNKNTDKAKPCKDEIVNMNFGVVTRSKKKTWDMLEKELLGESNDAQFLNSITQNVLFKEQSIIKQNMKEVDLYSDNSIMQIVSTPVKRNKYKMQNTEMKLLQTPTNMQSYEMVPYKSKNILEKTIAAMERCTGKFIAPKENSSEKESVIEIHRELEFDDVTDVLSIDQEAEFHSNVTLITSKNEQYYTNEIIAILKQSSSKKNENSHRSALKTKYNSGEYKYGYNDAEHLAKQNIIVESYAIKDNEEKTSGNKSLALISSSDKKKCDPWTKLIKELDLEECNNKDKNRDILTRKPIKKPIIYHENLKQYTNAHPNIKRQMQPTIDLNVEKNYDQNENKEFEQEALKQSTTEETLEQSNHRAICTDLNVQGNCIINDGEIKRKINSLLNSAHTREKKRETASNSEINERQTLRMKNVKTSPKFKLQVEDGSVKFKWCKRSSSNSSEESGKNKQRSTKQDDEKFKKDEQKAERLKYKRYLNNLFEMEDSSLKEKCKNDKSETESITEEKRSNKNSIKHNKEQRKMINALIAKDDEDVFSISSSGSETVNKGSGLLCDIFDE